MLKTLIIDQGTTSTRAMLFTPHGEPISSHQIELKQYFPQSGWVEHDPEEIWSAVKTCCATLLATMPRNKVVLGITNQRETTILWDKDSGEPISRAIVWQDRRTADYCNQLKGEQLEPIIYQKTGLLLDPYFSASKIKWLLNNIPHAFERAKKGKLLFGTIDSFLLWRLTGGKVHATDVTNASRTALLNIQTRQWDDDLLEIFAIPRQILPMVKNNIDDFGTTAEKMFGYAIPIVAMMGDQQAAMIGQGCLNEGDAKCTYGTGCFLMINTGEKRVVSTNRLLNTIAFSLNDIVNYANEGSIFAAGSIIKWFRDGLKIIQTAAETEILANSLSSNEGVYLVPAFTGLGAPYWDANVRGALYGLTRDTQRAHIVRAGLEAIAYQTKDLLANEAIVLKQLKVDGGVTGNKWLMQFLADILQIPIVVSPLQEATALGVAYLASLSIGQIKSLEEITAFSQPGKMFTPTMVLNQALELYAKWQVAIEKTR
ncbi:MAG: glycerol kinase GlpK [Gammaproteobacteria bacterium]|nr:glycerol kinase GlpK [Gammaproteobacteria bacterium]